MKKKHGVYNNSIDFSSKSSTIVRILNYHRPSKEKRILADSLHGFQRRPLLLELNDSFTKSLPALVHLHDRALDLPKLRERLTQQLVRHVRQQVLDANGARMWRVTHAQETTVNLESVQGALGGFAMLSRVLKSTKHY